MSRFEIIESTICVRDYLWRLHEGRLMFIESSSYFGSSHLHAKTAERVINVIISLSANQLCLGWSIPGVLCSGNKHQQLDGNS
jgi:hypothetical protein